MGSLGLAELITMFLVGAAFPIYGILDALRLPAASWQKSGHSRPLWVGLMFACVVLFLLVLPGVVVSLLYLAGVRPSVQRQHGALDS